MRIASKGPVAIPQEIRERLGLTGTDVELVAKGHPVRIVTSSHVARRTRGQAIVHRLRGRSSTRMSTDEILALTRK